MIALNPLHELIYDGKCTYTNACMFIVETEILAFIYRVCDYVKFVRGELFQITMRNNFSLVA